MYLKDKKNNTSVRIQFLIFILIITNSSLIFSAERKAIEIPISNKGKCKYVDMALEKNEEIRKKSTVIWDGNCINGYVSGFGILQILQPDGKKQSFKGSYLNGLEDGPFEMNQEHQGRKVKIQGIWKNGIPQSAVIEITNPNGKKIIYKGELKDSQFSGYGEITYEDGTIYSGNFLENQANGFGKAILSDGRVYEGEHFGGKPNGRGVWKFKDGSSYEGNNLNGVIHGKGKIIFSNGDIYEGDFNNGIRTGKGTYKWVSGRIYSGDFLKGKIEGYGKYFELNGDAAEGNTSDGNLEGNWIITKANGQKFLTEYRSGVLVNQSNLSGSDLISSQSQQPDSLRRQKGIDSLSCENYAKNLTSNQRPSLPAGSSGLASFGAILAQTTLIDLNTKEIYEGCMKKHGW